MTFEKKIIKVIHPLMKFCHCQGTLARSQGSLLFLLWSPLVDGSGATPLSHLQLPLQAEGSITLAPAWYQLLRGFALGIKPSHSTRPVFGVTLDI